MHTRTQLNVTIEASTAAQLRTIAAEVGAPVGDLADFFLRYAGSKVDRAALQKWALGLTSRRGRLGGAPRASERAVLDAVTRLHSAGEGDRWGPPAVFSLTEIARAAGQPLRLAYDALQGLALRGAAGSVRSEELDRWGRPVESLWWLESVPPPACDQGALYEGVRSVRADLAATTVEPAARAMMRLELRKVAGWSEAACALPEGLPVGQGEPFALRGPDWRPWFEARVQLTR